MVRSSHDTNVRNGRVRDRRRIGDGLTPSQRSLYDEVERITGWSGKDRRDVLLKLTGASAEDRAAVAEVYGGQGAGAEFLNGTAR